MNGQSDATELFAVVPKLRSDVAKFGTTGGAGDFRGNLKNSFNTSFTCDFSFDKGPGAISALEFHRDARDSSLIKFSDSSPGSNILGLLSERDAKLFVDTWMRETSVLLAGGNVKLPARSRYLYLLSPGSCPPAAKNAGTS